MIAVLSGVAFLAPILFTAIPEARTGTPDATGLTP